jgi:hypothetical protein
MKRQVGLRLLENGGVRPIPAFLAGNKYFGRRAGISIFRPL